MNKVSKKKVDSLGEDMKIDHFQIPIWNTANAYPKACAFKISKKRLVLCGRHCMFVRPYKDETDAQIEAIVKKWEDDLKVEANSILKATSEEVRMN